MLGRICSNVSAFCGNAINHIPQGVRQMVHETAVDAATAVFGACARKRTEQKKYIRPEESQEEIKPIEPKRVLEWGVGAAVGTCVAGAIAVTVPTGWGVGCGIVAGVVTMKAARAGARALLARNWI